MSAPVSAPEREIVSTRLFAAPRELVYQMWTDPKHIVHWWGPNGFTLTNHQMDVRPGGRWTSTMHGPDGTDYRNEVVYDEEVKHERLVYYHMSGPKFRAYVIFADLGKQTELTMRMVFESRELRDQTVRTFGAVEGLKQTLGRLEQYLGKA